jgi:hypothetical protein
MHVPYQRSLAGEAHQAAESHVYLMSEYEGMHLKLITDFGP